MFRAMKKYHEARMDLATPTPGHEVIQITHSPKLEEIPGGKLTAGQGSGVTQVMDDAEKAAYVRRQAEVHAGSDDAARAIHNQEFEAWKTQVEMQDLEPWDVKDLGAKRGKMHNLMLDPDTGRAVTNDPGALRETMMPEEYAGRAFHEPTVVDITSNRPISNKIVQAINELWDPITAVTGHRARTRAAVSGQAPGLYGRVMPTVLLSAPASSQTTRMFRPLMEEEEEYQDVPWAL